MIGPFAARRQTHIGVVILLRRLYFTPYCIGLLGGDNGIDDILEYQEDHQTQQDKHADYMNHAFSLGFNAAAANRFNQDKEDSPAIQCREWAERFVKPRAILMMAAIVKIG